MHWQTRTVAIPMVLLYWLWSALIVGGLLCLGLKIRILWTRDSNRKRILQPYLSEANGLSSSPLCFGFFHPYCDAGGGGERVLWTAIRDLQKQNSAVFCVVYTGDTHATQDQIIAKVKTRFAIALDPRRLAFVYLKKRYWVEDARYPRFTLILQSLASLILGYEAMTQFVPDIYFDTMGYAFTYPLVSLFTHAKIAAYVHYPTISSDMLQRVHEQRNAQNTTPFTHHWLWTTGKLIYYHAFAKIYSVCGSFAHTVMVNSTWTQGHINTLWHTHARVVYPPCDTQRMETLPIANRHPRIVSVAQFRPEKDHSMQLKALAHLLSRYPVWKTTPGFCLVFVGSARNQGDEDRIKALHNEAVHLGIQDYVQFEVNAPYDVLVSHLGKARVGLHTMWNEHFGIGVVEYMAAGLIPVAHNSAGPKLDIVTDYAGAPTGYLAHSEETFAECLHAALSLTESDYATMALNARASASDRFSEAVFCTHFLSCLREYL
ncbi:glycosyltransferase family 4 protein [Spinellus fusiger]|nr:glycosyltransferase family 4 protein [Spinellus fusiger]